MQLYWLAPVQLPPAECKLAEGCFIEIGGPENLTLEQVAACFERVSGRTAKQSHVPLPLMRVMAVVMRPLNPALARQIEAGILMDTSDMTFDPTETLKRFPMRLTPLAEVVRSRVVAWERVVQ